MCFTQSIFLTVEDVADFIEAIDLNRDGVVDYKEYNEMLYPRLDHNMNDENDGILYNDDKDFEIDGKAKVSTLDKVEPFGGEEIREEMIKRKQQEQQRIRDERLRQQADADALDVKVFEEELEASKRRVGGANPLISTTNTDNLLCTEFKFFNNSHPLRFIATGKNVFIAEDVDTAAERARPIPPLCCPNSAKHVITKSSYSLSYDYCSLCNSTMPSYWCRNCRYSRDEFYVCSRCFANDKIKKEAERRDPSKHSTFLRCSSGCTFSLQIPVAGGADKNNGCFMISMELRFRKIPMAGSLQTLLRLSLQNLSNNTKARGIAHLTPSGSIVVRPQKSNAEADSVNKLIFHPSVDLQAIEKRKQTLNSESRKLLEDLRTRINTELVQSFGCTIVSSEKIAGKIIDMFTEHPDCLMACKDSTAAFKVHFYRALNALSKGSSKFWNELRDHRDKLKEAKDKILSCSSQISDDKENKARREELIITSSNFIYSNEDILVSLGAYENPSKSLISIINAYKILFDLKITDDATSEKTETSENKHETNVEEDESEKENEEDNKNRGDEGEDEDEVSWDELKLMLNDPATFISKTKAGKDVLEKLPADELEYLSEATEFSHRYEEHTNFKFYDEQENIQERKSCERMEKSLHDWIQSVVSHRLSILSIESNTSQIESLENCCKEAVEAIDIMKAEFAVCVEATKLIKPSVRPDVWCIVSVNVNPDAGKVSIFLNDVLLDEQTDLNPSELKLQHKLTVLGGGKQAFNKGGDVRRILIHGAEFNDTQVKEIYYHIAASSTLISKQVRKIQALFRGYLERQRLAKRQEEESGKILFEN